MNIDYFPLKIAKAPAFCNRTSELKRLQSNIEQSKATLIVSPRRYGKTSLALNAIYRSKLPYAVMDFFSVVDEADIEKIILEGVGRIIASLETGPKRILNLANKFFSGLNIKISMDKLGLTVELNATEKKSTRRVLNVLERLESLLNDCNKMAVLFFDEFQQIQTIESSHAFESVFRQIAQSSDRIGFIFSGSSRHLLEKIFDDRNRPFYKLCDRINLPRITVEDYEKYINHAAIKRFGKPLSKSLLDSVFEVSELHPYYVNLIFSNLWLKDKFTENDIGTIWMQCIIVERTHISSELDLLSKNQRKLLMMIARNNGVKEPRSKEFELITKMSGASISQALKFLLNKDYVFLDIDGVYKIVDPLIKSTLVTNIS